MTKRIYHYHIQVDFEKSRQECKLGNYHSKYPNSKSYEDTFHFLAKSMVLVASRTRKYNDGSILSNGNHSITKQLIKGLLYYYSLANTFPTIKKLTITLKQASKNDTEYSEASDFIQPLLITNIVDKSHVSAAMMQNIIFEDTDKAKTIRIALSYWLKAMSSTNAQYKFLHFWQAYNAIFRYQSNKTSDFEGLRCMRLLVLQNHEKFKNSLQKTNELIQIDLSNKLRWSKLFLHDYSLNKDKAKASAFCDFILRYTDSKIMQIFLNHYKVSEKLLSGTSLICIKDHMNSNLNTDNIIEIPLLLCNKYSYFARNTIFHGEVQEYSFKIKIDQIDEEFVILNNIFESYLLDLIQNHSILRN